MSDPTKINAGASAAAIQAVAQGLRPGDRIRVTFEAEVFRTSEASGNRGVAVIYTRSGRGMNDGVWLVREPEYGEVLSVEVIKEAHRGE